MSNKEIINCAATFCGFFLFANGVSGIVQNRSYAVPQTFISVAALSYMGYKKFQPSHKRLKKRLDELFSSKTILTKGQLLFWDSKSKTKGFGNNKRIWWTKVEIEQDSFNRYIPANMRNLWAGVFSSAVHENLVRGCSIKTSVLKALSQTVLENIPDFFQNESIRSYVEKDRMIDVFALKMIHEAYEKVENCKSDEAVLDFFENAFNEKNSLFYNMGLNFEGKTNSFLNRSVYEDGHQKEFKVLETASYASILGCGVSAMFFSPFEYPIVYSGVTVGASLFYVFSQVRQKNHVEKQLSRFEANSFQLSEICLKKAPLSQKDGYIIWYQTLKNLTKREEAKITYQTALRVNDILKSFPQEVSCKKAGELLFLESVFKDSACYQAYKKIDSGLTLEKAVSECGLKCVYQLLLFNHFANKVKKEDERPLRSFLFEFQSDLVELKDAKVLANRKISKRVYQELKKLDKLYQEGEISSSERKEFMVHILEIEEKGIFMHVPVGVKLPRAVQRTLKTQNIRN